MEQQQLEQLRQQQQKKAQTNMGDSNRITREYFDSLLIELRYIDSALPSTKLTLFGEEFSTPIMTAALSHIDPLYSGGTAKLAKGAFDANALVWAGTGELQELQDMVATGAKTIKIIKPFQDDNLIYQQIEEAEQCGAFGVGMDVDHAFNNQGRFDISEGDPLTSKSVADLKNYIKATKLPFVIKGVLSEQDASKSMEAGASGIVISHHGGMQDYAVPPLMVLPKISKVINHKIPIFVDCGVMSGMDVFKALALGATAVSIGRGLMRALIANDGGAEGVRSKLVQMTEELACAMARTGSIDLSHIDPSVIWHRQ